MTNHLTRAEEQIKSNKSIELVKKSLSLYFEELDRRKWLKQIQEEYDLSFPKYRVMSKEEYNIYQSSLNMIVEDIDLYESLENIPKIEIDYSKNESYMTFDDYLNEKKIITESKKEVSEFTRFFIPKDNYDEEVQNYLENSELYQNLLNQKKEKEKENIIIENNNILYQGDFGSINYMSAATALANYKFNEALAQSDIKIKKIFDDIYKENIGWKGADNKVHNVQSKSVVNTLEKTMNEVSKIIGIDK